MREEEISWKLLGFEIYGKVGWTAWTDLFSCLWHLDNGENQSPKGDFFTTKIVKICHLLTLRVQCNSIQYTVYINKIKYKFFWLLKDFNFVVY